MTGGENEAACTANSAGFLNTKSTMLLVHPASAYTVAAARDADS